jgi:allophanate hydrolase
MDRTKVTGTIKMHAREGLPEPGEESMQPSQRHTIGQWLEHYLQGGELRSTFSDLSRQLAGTADAIWIYRATLSDLAEQLKILEERLAAAGGDVSLVLGQMPLFGVPFAVKDNIDIAGVPTTAACAAFSYVPSTSATTVQRLIDSGAVWVGKTNLDQFATGLSGTRSPYGRLPSTLHTDHISGGSSAGSALAVSLGVIPFALGTDTAGSGRVPAAFNNIVGLKPTPGRVSTFGVVPACRSIDCVSVFALTVVDAVTVLGVIEGSDVHDPYSAFTPGIRQWSTPLRVGVPDTVSLDETWQPQWQKAIESMQLLGHSVQPTDFSDLYAVGNSLYGGAWVAERQVTMQSLLEHEPEAIETTVRSIVAKAADFSAADAFRAIYALKSARSEFTRFWEHVDVLMVPSAPEHPTFAQIDADPIGVNARLGRYTNFVNLLGWSAIAVPAGLSAAGLPFGITFIAPGGSDVALARFATQYQLASPATMGATSAPLPVEDFNPAIEPACELTMPLAVVGAHLSGMPLNGQMIEAGARLSLVTTTSPRYRLHALPDSKPPKPGLERVAEGGRAIIVEVWDTPARSIGQLLARIPPPLGLGNLELRDGTWVKGFICEPAGLIGATDISEFGGWRAWVNRDQAALVDGPSLGAIDDAAGTFIPVAPAASGDAG